MKWFSVCFSDKSLHKMDNSLRLFYSCRLNYFICLFYSWKNYNKTTKLIDYSPITDNRDVNQCRWQTINRRKIFTIFLTVNKNGKLSISLPFFCFVELWVHVAKRTVKMLIVRTISLENSFLLIYFVTKNRKNSEK